MSRILRASSAILILSAILTSLAGASTSNDELLKVREEVWRAWFAGDTKTLEKLVPPETIVMSGGEKNGKNRPMCFGPLLNSCPRRETSPA